MTEAKIDKRKVTMLSVIAAGKDAKGKDLFHRHEATDYVRPDHLDVYVADAQTRWQSVTVSDEPDAGPAGYHGATAVPAGLALPDAGVIYPATETKDVN